MFDGRWELHGHKVLQSELMRHLLYMTLEHQRMLLFLTAPSPSKAVHGIMPNLFELMTKSASDNVNAQEMIWAFAYPTSPEGAGFQKS